MGHRFRVAICLACTSLFLASCGTVNPHYDPAKSHHSPEGFRNPDGAHNPGFARFLYWQWHRLWDEETPQHPERVDPRVHAGDQGDAGVRDAVEAAELEVVAEVAVGSQEVVEVAHLANLA